MGLRNILKHAWNLFSTNNTTNIYKNYGYSTTSRPDRIFYSYGNERTITATVINRFSIDASSIKIRHVKVDESGRFVEEVNSSLNKCLKERANKDQTSRAFFHDVFTSMLDEGCVALVPVDTDRDIDQGSFSIETLRTGKITRWFPDSVEVEVYNDRTGLSQKVIVNKDQVAIIENPFYSIMNAPNSTLKRLTKKLNILDVMDEQAGSGKLDLIIQLPYIVKTEARKQQAEQRRRDIETQLADSKYGIVYTDGTEKITQLNRSVDNNIMHQIEYLTSMLHSQLGTSDSILNGSADENTMANYMTRIIEPIVSSVVDEINTKFLSKTARSQGQRIMFFSDPFKLVPVTKLAEMADKFTRNEIMSSNEIRQLIGLKPSNDPRADELRNKNINAANDQMFAKTEDGTNKMQQIESTEINNKKDKEDT